MNKISKLPHQNKIKFSHSAQRKSYRIYSKNRIQFFLIFQKKRNRRLKKNVIQPNLIWGLNIKLVKILKNPRVILVFKALIKEVEILISELHCNRWKNLIPKEVNMKLDKEVLSQILGTIRKEVLVNLKAKWQNF